MRSALSTDDAELIAGRVQMPAEPARLAGAREALAGALERQHWNRASRSAVLVAVTEALANALEHGSTAGGEVGVGFVVGRERATVRVRDEGGMDPAFRPDPTPEPPSPTAGRGRGCVLMHGLAERVVIRPHGPGTEVRMEFAVEHRGA
jgi:anti-sigma regulatory factor (Ser/Thr protein kinase)